MTQKSRLDEVGKYEYTSPEGLVLKFRSMSDRERKSFLSGRLMVLQKQEVALKQYIVGLSNFGDGQPVSYSQLCAMYQPYYNDIRPIVELVGLGNSLATFETWNDPAFLGSTLGMIGRILTAEQALLTGDEIPAQAAWPTQDELDAMTKEQAEALGEDLPPRASRTATSRSAAPAAKSSAGRKTTKGTKRKTSATSPGPQ